MNHIGCAVREVLSQHRQLRPIDVLGVASLLSIAERGSPLCRYATEELISGHYAFAVSVAERYRTKAVPFDDLVQAACLGLVEAAVRWNPHRGVPFVGYAQFWVVYRVRAESRKLRSVVVVPHSLPVDSDSAQRAYQGDAALDTTTQHAGRRHMLTDHRELMPSQDTPWQVEEMLRAHLGERDAMVFMRRMGLYGPPETLQQIGTSLGMSPEGVRKIVERARRVLGPLMEVAV